MGPISLSSSSGVGGGDLFKQGDSGNFGSFNVATGGNSQTFLMLAVVAFVAWQVLKKN